MLLLASFINTNTKAWKYKEIYLKGKIINPFMKFFSNNKPKLIILKLNQLNNFATIIEKCNVFILINFNYFLYAHKERNYDAMLLITPHY